MTTRAPHAPVDVSVFRKTIGGLIQLAPEKDGYIGTENATGGNFVIELVPRKGPCLAFKTVSEKDRDGKTGAFNLAPMSSRLSGGKTAYTKEVSVTQSANNGNLPTTKWPKNHVKLVHISKGESGAPIINLWEIGVVCQIDSQSQTSYFFLTSQLVHTSRVCRNSLGTIILPDWPEPNKWPALFEQLDVLFGRTNLPLFERRGETRTNPRIRVKRDAGVILWYNLAYQVGVITMKDMDRRVHWTAIKSGERYKLLREGQKVRVKETGPAVNNYKHPRLTVFKEDALAVSPVSEK